MKLRLGQPVHTSDGPFGEVGDIVIDPRQQTVTHLVVEPHRQHYQARLVPMWLVSVDGDTVYVALDEAHLRQLQRVAFSDFVRLGDPVTVGDEWDIGTEDVVAMPYWDPEMGLGYGDGLDTDLVDVSYDRVPKGECEIRRRSEVMTTDDHVAGHVEGFLADENHLTGVVVRAGVPGLRRNVIVPMASVAKVRSDMIILDLDKQAFGRLPTAPDAGSGEERSRLDRLEQRTSRVAQRVRTGASGLAARIRTMAGRGTDD